MALDFVCQTFSDKKETEVTLFNAYIPVPAIEMRGSPIMEQMKDNLSYLSQRVKDPEDARLRCFYPFSVDTVSENCLRDAFSQSSISTPSSMSSHPVIIAFIWAKIE